MRFLTVTGLRLGEACNLRSSDVDWKAEVATLRRTKAGKTAQDLPLSAVALAILKDLGPGDGDAYVFSWLDGRLWAPIMRRMPSERPLPLGSRTYISMTFGTRPPAAGFAAGWISVYCLQAAAACLCGDVRADTLPIAGRFGGSGSECHSHHHSHHGKGQPVRDRLQSLKRPSNTAHNRMVPGWNPGGPTIWNRPESPRGV